MQDYKEISLGAQGISYVKKQLSYGLTLSKAVLKYIDLDRGQVMIKVSENVNVRAIYNFENAGLLNTAPASSWKIIGKGDKKYTAVPVYVDFSFIANIINSFLKNSDDNICVFENRNAKPTDPVLHSYQSCIWMFKNEVYHVLNLRSYPNEEIEHTIREAHSLWTFVGFLSSLPKVGSNCIHTEVTEENLECLAQRVEKIIVSAYDNEGFLVWHKTSLQNSIT